MKKYTNGVSATFQAISVFITICMGVNVIVLFYLLLSKAEWQYFAPGIVSLLILAGAWLTCAAVAEVIQILHDIRSLLCSSEDE